jgi:DNA replication protein DnaC
MALSNTDFDAIMRIYSDRQLNNRRSLDARRAEAYARFPRLREIAEEIAALSIRKAKAELGAEGVKDFDYNAALASLAEERTALLARGGYAPDYLEMHYTCPICHDTGFVGGKKCECFLREEINYLYTGSNDSEILQDENFGRFNLNYYRDIPLEGEKASPREDAVTAMNAALAFVKNFDLAFENLLIYGATGTGKSFLSHCIAHELIGQGKSVLYLTASDLFSLLGDDAFRRDRNSQGRHADQILSADLLIIDDLGTEYTNAFVLSRLFACVNERILKKKSTIISTNLNLSEFQKRYSERISSRIFSSYKLIRLSGSDIRIQKQMRGGD